MGKRRSQNGQFLRCAPGRADGQGAGRPCGKTRRKHSANHGRPGRNARDLSFLRQRQGRFREGAKTPPRRDAGADKETAGGAAADGRLRAGFDGAAMVFGELGDRDILPRPQAGLQDRKVATGDGKALRRLPRGLHDNLVEDPVRDARARVPEPRLRGGLRRRRMADPLYGRKGRSAAGRAPAADRNRPDAGRAGRLSRTQARRFPRPAADLDRPAKTEGLHAGQRKIQSLQGGAEGESERERYA